jgi:branched-subunit amino acid permease
MYSPNRYPTELYYERDALLRQEACNKRLGRPLATLSTMLVVIVLFVGLASIAVGPGRAIDYVGAYLAPVVGILGVLVVVVGLLMWEGGKAPNDRTKPFDRLYWNFW